MGMVEWDKKGDVSARGWLAGAMAPIGTGTIRASYSRYGTDAAGNPVAKRLALGYLHPLSKRTTLYTAAAHVSNDGTSATTVNGAVTAPGQSSNGFDFGILHTF
jgi:predicted porin